MEMISDSNNIDLLDISDIVAMFDILSKPNKPG